MKKSHFESGQEHYLRKEYKEAVAHFTAGAGELSAGSMMWLGKCYECGFGVEKDLVYAKELYKSCYRWLSTWERDEKRGIWIRERLEHLKDVPDMTSMTRFIEGVGNVKVIKAFNAEEPVIRYNLNEAVVTLSSSYPMESGFAYADKELKKISREWTCDGKRRFHDGYSLETDLFCLTVKKGTGSRYIKHIEGNRCTLYYPSDAVIDYIYIQKTIMRKVGEMLHVIAENTIPEILEAVSRRINVPYRKCRVVKRLNKAVACYWPKSRDIAFCYYCIQLPLKNLEALCIHELTHSFVGSHGKKFYDKMAELGGNEAVDIDLNLWKPGKWPYLAL